MEFIKLLARKNSDIQSLPPIVAAFFGDSITHGAFEIFRDRNSLLQPVYDYDSVYHARLVKMIAAVYPASPLSDCYGKCRKLYEQGADTTSLLCNHINHPNRGMHNLFAVSLFEAIVFDDFGYTILR